MKCISEAEALDHWLAGAGTLTCPQSVDGMDWRAA